MDTNTIVIAVLAMIAIGGVFQAFVYPYLSGEVRAEKRQAAVTSSARAAGAKRAVDRAQDVEKRRKQITESLKELDEKGRTKKLPLEAKLRQAGLEWPKSRYYLMCGVLSVITGVIVFFLSGNPLFIPPGLFVGGFGLPAWVINQIKKRRMKKFVNAFPESVDIIIRGVKAGLPLGDCLRVIAGESPEPVRSEFRLVIEATALGLPLGESIEKMYDRVPITEVNFFSIVLNIQAKSGGNLSEALGNLARVLRERKKMQAKVQAMSSEAKASAGIIGSLPFIVTVLLYFSKPDYISQLWTTTQGRTVMAISGFWMFMGIMSMKKMINFDM